MTPLNHPEVAESILTCEACPEQYEGKLKDGRWFYFRTRFSYARLAIGDDRDSVMGREDVAVFIGDIPHDDLKGWFNSPEERDAVFARLMEMHAELMEMHAEDYA